VTVLHAIPKGRKLETVIQKCAELGVLEFRPVMSERTVPRWDELRTERRGERWQSISRGATEQCGRATVMPVRDVASLPEALENAVADLKIVLDEEASRPLREVLEHSGRQRPESVALLIGPEGGFSRAELNQACSRGFIPASLGPRILRTETVAPVVVGILLYVNGDL
jgi:16S rRNA (uracil1498-N3)-methyltransferase